MTGSRVPGEYRVSGRGSGVPGEWQRETRTVYVVYLVRTFAMLS